jgi:alginate O-acetyltransferase complex protein AlgJ
MNKPNEDQPVPVSKLAQLPESRSDGKVVRGKNDWLFLDYDSNEVMMQQRGELLFSDEQLEEWARLLEHRMNWLGGQQIAYRFLIAPNPHSVYPDMLPFELAPDTLRPVTQLLQFLTGSVPAECIVYPLESLVTNRSRPVYTQTNTHWTDLGAFVAYEALMDDIGDYIEARRISAADLVFSEELKAGDLGHKVNPIEASVHVWATVPKPAARMVRDNRVFLNGHRIDYECPSAGGATVLVLGDSFSHAMLPFLAETFGRLTFAHLSALDRELVAEVAPQLVVSVMNERFMIRVPSDEGAKSLRDLETEKRARGAVYPPRTHQGNRPDTPAPWRRNPVSDRAT